MRISRRRGIALIVVLSVLTLLLIIILTVSVRGIGALSAVKGMGASKRSLCAAEAAVAVGILGVVNDRTFNASFSRQQYTENALYSLEVFNNLAGAGPLTASNGQVVPVGFVYLLGQGSRTDRSFSRQAGVLMRTSVASNLNYAMAAGGRVELRQHTTIKGGLKANGEIDLRAQTEVLPLGGNGRLLSSDSIRSRGPTRLDPSQDVRARNEVRGNIRGTDQVVENDVSDDTKPFINDGRTDSTLGSGETGQVLPYPNIQALLEADIYGNPGPNIASHSETSIAGALDLGGKTHWFPNGIKFESSASVSGPGTVVVGNGNQAEFECDLGPGLKMNVLALYPDNGSGRPVLGSGDPDIRFRGDTDIEGLLLAGSDLRCNDRNFRFKGQMIAYTGDIEADMRAIFTLLPESIGTLLGFDGFSTGVGATTTGSGPITITSWQRF